MANTGTLWDGPRVAISSALDLVFVSFSHRSLGLMLPNGLKGGG
jgi:hypothetical protein